MNRREGQLYFEPLSGKPIWDIKHTVTHVIRKQDLAFKKNQPLAPNKITIVPNTLVNHKELAGKRKKNSPTKSKDSNEAGHWAQH